MNTGAIPYKTQDIYLPVQCFETNVLAKQTLQLKGLFDHISYPSQWRESCMVQYQARGALQTSAVLYKQYSTAELSEILYSVLTSAVLYEYYSTADVSNSVLA